jgi:hypothetical protein
MAAAAKLAGAFRLAPAGVLAWAPDSVLVERRSQSDRLTIAGGQGQERTRAAAVAESLTMLQRHERLLVQAGGGSLRGGAGAGRLSTNDARRMMIEAPAGSRTAGSGRRTGTRASASAARRDNQ